MVTETYLYRFNLADNLEKQWSTL